MSSKITHFTEEKQIEAMKINLQGSGQNTAQLGNHYDFYKNINMMICKRIHEEIDPKTARCFVSYFRKLYSDIFFGTHPDVELFKLKPHKRSCILQSVKKALIITFEIQYERHSRLSQENNRKI